jgi:phosphatidylglycerol:prolipoprotein diacylglycerol transferase
LANFQNGELYGRAAEGVAWAMKFPRALFEKPKAEGVDFPAAMQAAADASPALKGPVAAWEAESLTDGAMFEWMLAVQRDEPEVTRAIEPYLFPRHPSQLYEGLLEGLLLFVILWWVRNRFPQAPHGVLTGLFFVFYAGFRIFAEQFREPDAKMVGPLTSGQFLSVFMILAGLAFLASAKFAPSRPGTEAG